MDVLLLLLMVLLLLLEGFFTGSEIALVNADRILLHARATQGDRGAQLLLKMFRRPEQLLSTTLIGTNIAVVSLTTIGTLLAMRWFGDAGELVAIAVLTPLLLTFGEVVPKSVYQQNADQLAPRVIHVLRVFRIALYPIVLAFAGVARLAARLTGSPGLRHNLFISRQQLRNVVEMAERGAEVGLFDHTRITRAIRFAETTVGEAMVPLAEIIALDIRRDTRAAYRLVRDHGYNRMPVYEGNVGNVVGILTFTVWDLMEGAPPDQPLAELIRPPLYVSAAQPIDELLPLLRERDDHMAIVVDEFGSAVGMITIEDIFEEVVGDFNVGYDFDEYRPRRKHHVSVVGEDVYEMDARVTVSELNELLQLDLPSAEFHTVGGFVEARLRRIPQQGDSVSEGGWRFTVTERTERAILRLRVEAS
jgi:CBS domain containing-hemolysin-like protein